MFNSNLITETISFLWGPRRIHYWKLLGQNFVKRGQVDPALQLRERVNDSLSSFTGLFPIVLLVLCIIHDYRMLEFPEHQKLYSKVYLFMYIYFHTVSPWKSS